MIGAVRSLNEAKCELINLKPTMKPKMNSKRVKRMLMIMQDNSWGYLYLKLIKGTQSKINVQTVRPKKRIKSGNVSLMLPLYPERNLKASTGIHMSKKTRPTYEITALSRV